MSNETGRETAYAAWPTVALTEICRRRCNPLRGIQMSFTHCLRRNFTIEDFPVLKVLQQIFHSYQHLL
ncbi:hypothetical protein HZ326_20986 [Fusarium oxysporum f. sp. albedinis]|nr:hypothetical protein HZ326_20986 [Fusarium oxysporum f. sp. albedinis]